MKTLQMQLDKQPLLALLFVGLAFLFTSAEGLRLQSSQLPQRHNRHHNQQIPLTYNTHPKASSSGSFGDSIDFKYYDNLEAPNLIYYYGSITKEDYEMRVELYKLDDYEQCPEQTPFASVNMQQCLKCPADRPLFNIGLRQCEQCKVNINDKCDQIVFLTHPEMLNKNNTGTGVVSNSTAAGGTGMMNLGNNAIPAIPVIATPTLNSMTPTPTIQSYGGATAGGNSAGIGAITTNTNTYTPQPYIPPRSSDTNSPHVFVWTPSPSESQQSNSTGEVQGNSSNATSQGQNGGNVTNSGTGTGVNTGNLNSNTTATSNINSSFVEYESEDQYVEDPNAPKYRVTTNQTATTAPTPALSPEQLIAQSQLRDNTQFYQTECPVNSPFFNLQSRQCQSCGNGYEYVPNDKNCQPIIYASNPMNNYIIMESPDQILTQNQAIREANPTRNVVLCPLDRPVSIDNICVGCGQDKIYNLIEKKCQNGCSEGQVFNRAGNNCINATFITNPDAGNLLSPINNYESFKQNQLNKIQSSYTVMKCPDQSPFLINGKCGNCEGDTPLFNIDSKKCEGCSRGRYYHADQRKCLSDVNSKLQVKRMIPNIV